MPYIVEPRIEIEALGAVWKWAHPDNAMAELASIVEQNAGLELQIDDELDVEEMWEKMPGEAKQSLYPVLPRMFLEGVVAWEGVEDADGEPLPCTAENRRAIPTQDKIQVAALYLAEVQDLQQKKGP